MKINYIFKGSIFFQFVGHVISAFILSSLCFDYYLWIPSYHVCKSSAFFMLLIIFECFPRIFGYLFGKLENNFKKSQKKVPIGHWVMVGNFLPEYSIEIYPPYPSTSNTLITNGYAYTQSCTIGGFFMVILHTWTYKFQKINIKTGNLNANGKYFLPVIENPHAGFQTDVLLVPTSDESIWARRYKSMPDYTLYYWIHESNPSFGYDDWFKIDKESSNFNIIFMITIALTVLLFMSIWTWGGIIIVIFVEFAAKHAQLHIFNKYL